MQTDALDIFACMVGCYLIHRRPASGYGLHLFRQARAIEKLFDTPDDGKRGGMRLRRNLKAAVPGKHCTLFSCIMVQTVFIENKTGALCGHDSNPFLPVDSIVHNSDILPSSTPFPTP